MLMLHLVRAAGVLMLLGLSGWAYVSGELQFAAAGLAVAILMEILIALRARRDQSALVPDRSRLSAVQVSCTEEDGVLKVALLGKAQGTNSRTCWMPSLPGR